MELGTLLVWPYISDLQFFKFLLNLLRGAFPPSSTLTQSHHVDMTGQRKENAKV